MKIIQKSKKECESHIIEIIRKKAKQKIIIGFVGGRSIASIIQKIITSTIPLENIELFLLDERYVPLTDNQSNYKLINETAQGKLTVHSFNHQTQTPQEYNSLLNNKPFDIIIVSSGEDGHIASLFPNHPSIKDETIDYIKVNHAPKKPKTRMSATKNFLKQSKTAILLFFGETKQEAFENFQNKNLTEIECPAKTIKNIKDSYVFVDFD